MLLNSRMTTGPLSSDHSVSKMENIKQIFKTQAKSPFSSFQSYPAMPDLRYFNMRVIQRLHRYRSVRRPWPDMSTPLQNSSYACTNCESPLIYPDVLSITPDTVKCSNASTQKSAIEPKPYFINDYINATTLAKDASKKNSLELDPLHSSIQQDLITLRRLLKVKQRKFNDNTSVKTRSNAGLIVEPVRLINLNSPINVAYS